GREHLLDRVRHRDDRDYGVHTRVSILSHGLEHGADGRGGGEGPLGIMHEQEVLLGTGQRRLERGAAVTVGDLVHGDPRAEHGAQTRAGGAAGHQQRRGQALTGEGPQQTLDEARPAQRREAGRLGAAPEPRSRGSEGEHHGPHGGRDRKRGHVGGGAQEARTSSRMVSALASSVFSASASSETRIWRALASIRFSPAERPRSWSRRQRSRTTSETLMTSPEASFSRLAL